MHEFTNDVLACPARIANFNDYKEALSNENNIHYDNCFSISKSAIMKECRSLKSVIKLDKNFLIHIQGDFSKIEVGEDSKGKFYKMYYDEEY